MACLGRALARPRASARTMGGVMKGYFQFLHANNEQLLGILRTESRMALD